MNDMELDELLNTWKAPQPREAMRESVRAGIEAQRRQPRRQRLIRWRWLATAAAVLVVAVLVVNPTAFSRKASVPFIVESEIRHYSGDVGEAAPGSDVRRPAVPPGSAEPFLAGILTSYNEAGSEVIISASLPNRPLKSLLGKTFLTFLDAADTLKRLFMPFPDEEAEAFAVVYASNLFYPLDVGRREELLSSGCQTSHDGAKVVGQEVILNYPVTSVQQPQRGGMEMATLWMAPDLSCFALRLTIHAKQPDGTWKLLIEKQAVKVTKNP
jgi:hypothetical protein